MVIAQRDIIISLISIYITTYLVYGFNLSPKPNRVFEYPSLNKSDNMSTYFGFSLNLRESRVIVGAPRFEKRGGIYICRYDDNSLACEKIKFKAIASVNKNYDNSTGEWFGATMDGGFKDSDKLVACAPRLMRSFPGNEVYCNGICLLFNDTLRTNHSELTHLFYDEYQIKGGREQGFSVHMTNDLNEILIGAPNDNEGSGAVINLKLSGRSSYKPSYAQNHLKKPFSNSEDDRRVEYFGFAVSSGKFNTTHRDDIQYITSSPHAETLYGKVIIFENQNNITSIKHSFIGTHFGSYFGYALLVEDLNNDGLSDVIITAPMYSTQDNIEQGAVFVYMNKGNFDFELPKTITSPINNESRFGNTISKLGDINGDGFNDVAISAPYADNGTVFIYLGSPSGLDTNPSQNLTVTDSNHEWGPYLFGYGLSKGYDIDENGFNDIAVGAPNAQTVYIFRSYPVVKVLFKLNSTQETTTDQNDLDFSFCYKLMTSSKKIKELNITIKCNLDPELNRATWNATKTNMMIINRTANLEEQCLEYNAVLSISSIQQPIESSISYDLIDKIPNTEEFCEKCAVLDPVEPNNFKQFIEIISNVDLSVTSTEFYHNEISGVYSVTYEINNLGEKAFEPTILVTSSKKIPFKNIPPLCDEKEIDKSVLMCKLNNKQPMTAHSKVNFTITYDVSQIDRSSMFELLANVSSAGNETNINNNFVKDRITLKKSYKAMIKANSTSANNVAENESKAIFKVQNTGLNAIEELLLLLEIPISNGISQTPIVDRNSIEVHGTYSQQNLTFRDPNGESLGTFNHKDPDSHFRELLFYCTYSETILCSRMVFNVSNFLPNDTIQIFVHYNVHISQINQMFTGEKTHFVIVTKLVVIQTQENIPELLQIVFQKSIWNMRSENVPTFVIILAIFGGVLLLIALTICLWKVGFFRRMKKDDLLVEFIAPKAQTGNDNKVFCLEELKDPKGQTESDNRNSSFDNKAFDEI